MDGISLLMVLLTAFLATLAVLFSWKAITDRVAAYYGLLLLATAGILGVFLALDLFLFYLFWEVMLIPLFFLICVWGEGQRVTAALRFFLFTIGGSLLMLLAIIGLYLIHGQATGVYTFALPELLQTPLAPLQSCLLFSAFLLAFAVKTPIFPLHGWLPDAYTDRTDRSNPAAGGAHGQDRGVWPDPVCLPPFPGGSGFSLPRFSTSSP